MNSHRALCDEPMLKLILAEFKHHSTPSATVIPPEIIHRRGPWKSKQAVELATLEWVSWFNHHRLLEPIGYIPPAEAEANYYRCQTEQAVTA